MLLKKKVKCLNLRTTSFSYGNNGVLILLKINLFYWHVHKLGPKIFFIWARLCLKRVYLTNRFQVTVRLFSNRSQMTSKCGKTISDTLGCASCATFLFLPHFDVICDLLLNRRTATWNLFVKQTTSKCVSYKKSGTGGTAKCVTDVLTTFWHPLWSITEQTHGNLESICFI